MSSDAPDTTESSRITAEATKEAARIQAASEAENRALQERMFGKQQDFLKEQDVYNRGLTEENQANWKPYMDKGVMSLGHLFSATNDENSWFNKKFTQEDMQQDDGYKFRLAQGMGAVNSSLAAKGGLLSGRAIQATQEFGQGMASEEFNNAYARFTNDKNNRYSALSNLANMGMQATNGYQGGSVQSTTGTQMANVAGQFSQNMGNIMQNGANNQANLVMANAKQQAELKMLSQGGGGPGFLGGAATGASIGASFGPWGAVAGGVIGGLGSLL